MNLIEEENKCSVNIWKTTPMNNFWDLGINLVYTLDQVYTWYKSNINISVKLYKVYTLIKFSILCSILDIMG